MIRAKVPWPRACLTAVAAPVGVVTSEILDIWQNMISVTQAMLGLGVAAPQLGIGKRLAVVDASRSWGRVLRIANPEVLQVSNKIEFGEEASPNLPFVSVQVECPRDITVRYIDKSGELQKKDFIHLWARSTLHHIDHLNGLMYFDALSKLKRDMLLKRARKLCA